jgi:putative two-component system response regulator
MMDTKTTIMIVDDDRPALRVTARLLQAKGYRTITCENGFKAIERIKVEHVDVVLTDFRMPGVSGLDLLAELKSIGHRAPVVLMTGQADIDMALEAVRHGVFEIMTKPVQSDGLAAVVERALHAAQKVAFEKKYRLQLEETVQVRTQELSDALQLTKSMSGELIRRLTAIAEFRDTDTGRHISRIGLYCNKLAEVLGHTSEFVEAITFASSMHDIGKVAIPDDILLKRGPLTPEEYGIMKTHTEIGRRLLEGSEFPVIQLAASVAMNHHEQFNGGGYPRGLRGEDIPHEGRIVKIADQYDALRSERAYKQGMSHRDTYRVITSGEGRTRREQFDPAVLEAFAGIAPLFDEIYETHRDIDGTGKMWTCPIPSTPQGFAARLVEQTKVSHDDTARETLVRGGQRPGTGSVP